MSLLRVLLLMIVVGVITLTPHFAFAADATFFGPIIPPECHCEGSAPEMGCVLQVLENLMNFTISMGVILFVLIASYAGFLFMTSAGNPHNKEQGRTILTNAVVGLLIALSAWLLVDFVMKTLYNGRFGPWNSILGTGNACLAVNNPPDGRTTPGTTGVTGQPGTGTQTGTGANCPAADPSIMVAFPATATSGGTERATQTTVQNFLRMREAAARDGIDLRVTDGYRPESEQVSLWNDRANVGNVARPCSLGGSGSVHNSGQAIDIAVGCSNGQSNCNTATYNWLRNNGAQYGFRNAVPTDPVHWSPSGH